MGFRLVDFPQQTNPLINRDGPHLATHLARATGRPAGEAAAAARQALLHWSPSYSASELDTTWMWVKMEDLGDHRCWSSLVLTIHNFGVSNFEPYPHIHGFSMKSHTMQWNVNICKHMCLLHHDLHIDLHWFACPTRFTIFFKISPMHSSQHCNKYGCSLPEADTPEAWQRKDGFVLS